ncbi:hypothetical protein [Paratractidigestivibacter sp.]|uniref:hypothetical protein n=1 Tax=Paratractidigestivibacter sp. TaxID=2847316 RepID=UPI002ABE52D6|nr:hypothetical protein [Paratractidigestivibacter sp.]
MKKSAASILSLVTVALLAVIAVVYAVNGTAVNNFNGAVVGYIAAAAVCMAVYAFVDVKYADVANLVAVPFTVAAMAQVLINGINTFADVFSGITMFNSQGGVEWIIAIAVLLAVAMLAEIVSCFMSREPKRA